jgi:hypothetical protein
MSQQSAESKEVLDDELYESAKPHLEAALQHTLASGRNFRDWIEFCVHKFGDAVLPYIRRLAHELPSVDVETLNDATRSLLFGTTFSAEEREALIRERAYQLAEAREFTGGNPELDWLEAEQEVDAQLGTHAGVVGFGRDAVHSLGELAADGFEGIRNTLNAWLANR